MALPKTIGNWLLSEEGIDWKGVPDNDYFIAKDRLLELRAGDPAVYDWLVHIPAKTWVTRQDALDLNTILLSGVEEFGLELNQTIYDTTIREQTGILNRK